MLLEMNFTSKELKRQTGALVILPEEKEGDVTPYRTLWLFHGLKGNQTTWIRNTAIERYATKHRLAVVMPNADRSWYTDTAYGANYFSFVTRELPALCFKNFSQMSQRREDNIVAGNSMGGYGAIKAALTCPDRYGSCISLSGSLDITRKGRPYFLEEWQSIFGFGLKSAEELTGSAHDIFALAANNKREGRPFPKLYLWCGLEDSLITVNRLFDRHLTELDVAHKFESSEGDHTWKWWDLHIAKALEWILSE